MSGYGFRKAKCSVEADREISRRHPQKIALLLAAINTNGAPANGPTGHTGDADRR